MRTSISQSMHRTEHFAPLYLLDDEYGLDFTHEQLVDNGPVIIPYKAINNIYAALYGIITRSFTANYSFSRCTNRAALLVRLQNRLMIHNKDIIFSLLFEVSKQINFYNTYFILPNYYKNCSHAVIEVVDWIYAVKFLTGLKINVCSTEKLLNPYPLFRPGDIIVQ